MKKNLYVLTFIKLLGVTLLICFLFASQNFAQKYGFETAVIDKTSKQIIIDVMIIEVTVKIYVIGAGFKEAYHQTEKRTNLMTNQVEESRSVTIIDKDWIVTYDPETNEGTRMKNTFFDNFKGKSEKDQQKFSKDMADAMNTDVKEIGTEEIAGKLSTVTLAETKNMGMKTKTWLYKNFVMKLESESPGMSLRERVIRFQEDVEVAPTVFLIADEIILQTVKLPK
ncbi:MAG: hypothetical protein ACC651_11710 [Candidatus Scalindua sp.]